VRGASADFALGEWTRPVNARFACDRCSDGIRVLQQIVVCHPEHTKTLSFKEFGSASILLGSPVMAHAVQFNNESGGLAEEVRYERTDRMLPAELQTRQSAAPQ
jgi:hypothetical protein